ncbi:MAG: ROK family protein [Anaerolineae bacterium]|nr:ROK family protein [Anaerolineae bacterium]
MMPVFGGIEAGGTKFVCAIGSGPHDLRHEIRFPTTTPKETIGRAIAYFREQAAKEPLAAIGIAAFGPVDPNPSSPNFGYITTTPKPDWANTDFGQAVSRALNLPVGFDTDVNGAALGEHRWGAAQDLDNFIYLTIGTGIGGGAMVNGRLVHGLIHPEMGHIILPARPDDPHPEGFCPFHGHCLEGMASGPAIGKRWGARAETLPLDHSAWVLEAHYLATGLVDLICTLSPERIIMGGGVMEQPIIFPLLRREVQTLLNGYVQSPVILQKIDTYIVPPGLGNRAGVLGAIALAEQAYRIVPL